MECAVKFKEKENAFWNHFIRNNAFAPASVYYSDCDYQASDK
jgi:hypothetical protein